MTIASAAVPNSTHGASSKAFGRLALVLFIMLGMGTLLISAGARADGELADAGDKQSDACRVWK